MPENENVFTADPKIIDAIESELEVEIAAIRKETSLCVPCVRLYQQAARGWRDEWQEEPHPAWCPRCGGAARVGFRHGDPRGFWIFRELGNAERPKWWRDAVARYIELDAPFWLRVGARFWTRPEFPVGMRTATALSPTRGIKVTEITHKKLYNTETKLQVRLVEELAESEEGPGAWKLAVQDVNVENPSRTVACGLAGMSDYRLFEVGLKHERHLLVGEIGIATEELAALGEPDYLLLIPAVELKDAAADGDDHPGEAEA